jgi:hypothetical protein
VPQLGGDHHLVAHRRQRLADQLFIGERAIDLGGVEEIHTAVTVDGCGRMQERNRQLRAGRLVLPAGLAG